MKCPKCNVEIDENEKFCHKCGTEIKKEDAETNEPQRKKNKGMLIFAILAFCGIIVSAIFAFIASDEYKSEENKNHNILSKKETIGIICEEINEKASAQEVKINYIIGLCGSTSPSDIESIDGETAELLEIEDSIRTKYAKISDILGKEYEAFDEFNLGIRNDNISIVVEAKKQVINDHKEYLESSMDDPIHNNPAEQNSFEIDMQSAGSTAIGVISLYSYLPKQYDFDGEIDKIAAQYKDNMDKCGKNRTLCIVLCIVSLLLLVGALIAIKSKMNKAKEKK